MKIIENVLSDRGSKYAVSGGPVETAEDAKAFISAGIAQANASHDAQVEAMRNDYEQAEADMSELRGPRGWV